MGRFNFARADSAQTKDSEAAKYYQESIGSETQHNAMQNLDDPEVLAESMQQIVRTSSRNFLVEFSDSDAWVGFDLSAQTILNLLDSKARPAGLSTRWINIWFPFQHKPLLELLAKHYDFSPRLLAVMCSDPRRVKAEIRSMTSRTDGSDSLTPSISRRSMHDIEKGEELSDIVSLSSNSPAGTGNIYDIADEVWHYTSVDQGRNCKPDETYHSVTVMLIVEQICALATTRSTILVQSTFLYTVAPNGQSHRCHTVNESGRGCSCAEIALLSPSTKIRFPIAKAASIGLKMTFSWIQGGI